MIDGTSVDPDVLHPDGSYLPEEPVVVDRGRPLDTLDLLV